MSGALTPARHEQHCSVKCLWSWTHARSSVIRSGGVGGEIEWHFFFSFSLVFFFFFQRDPKDLNTGSDKNPN